VKEILEVAARSDYGMVLVEIMLVAQKCVCLEYCQKLQYLTKAHEAKGLEGTVTIDYWSLTVPLVQNDDVVLEYCHWFLTY